MRASITQDMRYRQSLMQYAARYGVGRASRKYNRSRSYIYFWRKRWNGTVSSLACQSRRPHYHPNDIHRPEEIALIQHMRLCLTNPHGTPHDNAVMESVFGWFKECLRAEYLNRTDEPIQRILDKAVFKFNQFCPSYELHYKSPVQFKIE